MPRIVRRRSSVIGAMASAVCLLGCSETYCQSGPKYGTTCYSINEIEWQRTLVRDDWPVERETQPSPGCVLATPSGLVQQPLSATGQSPSPRPPYLMSGACVSRQRRVHGAY